MIWALIRGNRVSLVFHNPLNDCVFLTPVYYVTFVCLFQVNVRNIDGATPLCDACCCGNTDIVQLLLAHGALVNPPLLLATPLHEAVLRGNSYRSGCVLFNDALNTFYLCLYDVGHSDSERKPTAATWATLSN